MWNMSIASSLIFCMTEKTGVNFGKVGRCSRNLSALLPLHFLFLMKNKLDYLFKWRLLFGADELVLPVELLLII